MILDFKKLGFPLGRSEVKFSREWRVANHGVSASGLPWTSTEKSQAEVILSYLKARQIMGKARRGTVRNGSDLLQLSRAWSPEAFKDVRTLFLLHKMAEVFPCLNVAEPLARELGLEPEHESLGPFVRDCRSLDWPSSDVLAWLRIVQAVHAGRRGGHAPGFRNIGIHLLCREDDARAYSWAFDRGERARVADLLEDPDLTWAEVQAHLLHGFRLQTCFISHAAEDESMATALADFLEAQGIRTWLAARDCVPGNPLSEQIESAIESFERTLILLSPASMRSEWVRREISLAIAKERRTARPVLLPLNVGERDDIEAWGARSEEGNEITAQVKKLAIPTVTSGAALDLEALRRVTRVLRVTRPTKAHS